MKSNSLTDAIISLLVSLSNLFYKAGFTTHPSKLFYIILYKKEGHEDTWFVPRLPSSNKMLQLYNRPVYFYEEGHPDWSERGVRAIVYSGGRWLVLEIEDYKKKSIEEWIVGNTAEYHGRLDIISVLRE